MSRLRWALIAGSGASLLGGGAAGAVLYMSTALSATPAAAVNPAYTQAAPLAPAATPSPRSGTHRGSCPNHSGSSTSTSSS